MFANRFAPKGYQQITDLSSAVSLTVPNGANYAIIEAETQSVRWRDDGTAPTLRWACRWRLVAS